MSLKHYGIEVCRIYGDTLNNVLVQVEGHPAYEIEFESRHVANKALPVIERMIERVYLAAHRAGVAENQRHLRVALGIPQSASDDRPMVEEKSVLSEEQIAAAVEEKRRVEGVDPKPGEFWVGEGADDVRKVIGISEAGEVWSSYSRNALDSMVRASLQVFKRDFRLAPDMHNFPGYPSAGEYWQSIPSKGNDSHEVHIIGVDEGDNRVFFENELGEHNQHDLEVFLGAYHQPEDKPARFCAPGEQDPKFANKELAVEIAESLFTSGMGRKAARLTLVGSNGKYLGGWSEVAVSDHIESFLNGQ